MRHPYAYDEVFFAANDNDIKRFDRALFGHVYHIIRNFVTCTLLSVSMGLFIPQYGTFLSPYKRRLMWTSSLFAVIADMAMLYFGGALKAKQKITGRLGDILSYMYLASALMAYYERLGDKKQSLRPIVQWALDDCFYQIQEAFIGLFQNFSLYTRLVKVPFLRLFSIGAAPSDALGKRVAQLIQQDQNVRDFLTDGIFTKKY